MSKMLSKREIMGEDGWISYQKIKQNEKVKRYRQTYRGEVNSLKVVLSRKKKKQLLVEYKGGKCEICGFDKPIYDIYDFHHKDPNQKDFGLSGWGKNLSLELCKIEADKCMLLCANCHREIHYQISEAKINQKISIIQEKYKNNINQLLETEITENYIEKLNKKKNKSQSQKILKKEHFCKCGNKRNKNSKKCLSCYRVEHANNIPLQKDLEKLIWEKPTTHIAKDYGVSDKAVDKWCKKYNISKPPRGYWQKVKTSNLKN